MPALPQETLLSLFDLAWKSTLLLLSPLTITFILRKRSAALRHAVWHWSLVALLLLPGATFLVSDAIPARW